MPLIKGFVIKIYLPLLEKAQTNISEIPKIVGEGDSYFSQIIELISTSEIVGHLGNYESVYELSTGEEYYTPKRGSHPRQGHIGTASSGRVLILTTYAVNCDWQEVENFVEKIANIHPWEHPVIECFGPNETMLWHP